MFLRALYKIICVIFIFSTLLRLTGEAGAETRNPTEYEVKAAYIYNFAKFVEWPRSNSPEPAGTLGVCVVGNDPFGPALASIEGKMVAGKPIRLRREPAAHEVEGCDILFISNSEEASLDRVLAAVKGLNILTIGDTEGFAAKGVMINFYMDNKNVRFEINPKAAAGAGLKISSNLLKIARIVGGPSGN